MQGDQVESASMSLGRFSHVYDLMDMGNKAFRENRFEEVILYIIGLFMCDILNSKLPTCHWLCFCQVVMFGHILQD